MWSERETAMRVRMGEMVDKLDAKAHDLAPLEVGDRVRVQNQTGPHKTRWSRTGTVMEVNQEYNQYHVKMDGSRRTTARNRKFLRKIRAVGPGPGHGDGAGRRSGRGCDRRPRQHQRRDRGLPQTRVLHQSGTIRSATGRTQGPSRA